MAGLQELNSFISKFDQLWSRGFEANLHFWCFNGQSYVYLQTALGTVVNFQYSGRNTPSRQRRRAKRAEARKAATNIEATDSENVPEVEQEFVEAVYSNAEVISVVEESSESTDSANQDFNNTEEVLESEDVITTAYDDEAFPTDENITKENDIFNDDKATDSIHRIDHEAFDTVEVFATVLFDNSPYSSLQQEELESFTRCVNSMDHLAHNIANITVEGHDTSVVLNGRFKHEVQVKMNVRENNLFESANEYIFRHLGRDHWDRRNGTVISLIRIQ